MPYDASLDEQLFAKSWEGSGTKITVGVYSYNNGAKKVQITRELTENQGGKPGFAKLGRLTKEELKGILPLLNEAVGLL
jgi:hypothetical protein